MKGFNEFLSEKLNERYLNNNLLGEVQLRIMRIAQNIDSELKLDDKGWILPNSNVIAQDNDSLTFTVNRGSYYSIIKWSKRTGRTQAEYRKML